LDQRLRMMASQYELLDMSTENGLEKWNELHMELDEPIDRAFKALKDDMRVALGDVA
jgi:hypothetical protein